MLRAPLFQFTHGDHVCVFYRSEDALMNVLTPYVAEGLRKGEKCFLVQKERVFQRILYDLQFIGVDTDAEIARGAIEFQSIAKAYRPKGTFEPEEMMVMLGSAIADALREGFTGFRSAGELSWAIEGQNECSKVIGYEEMVAAAYPGKPATGMCQYPIESFPADILARILEAHQQRIIEPDSFSSYSSIAINQGKCSAEIVADRFVSKPSYSYVVQRRSPNEVLGWGVTPDFESAKSKVEEVLASV